LDWAAGQPFIEIAGNRFNLPLPQGDTTQLDSGGGNLGLPGVWAFQIRGTQIVTGLLEGDTIDGGYGDDLIEGGIGNDVLTGGLGADTIIGGAGHDVFMDVANDQFVDAFTGGAGHDEYRTLDLNTLRNGTAEDIITDFEAGDGGDRIIVYNNGSAANPFDDGTLQVRKSGADTVILYRDSNGVRRSVLRLKNVDATLLTAYNLGGLAFPVVAAVNIDDNDQGNTLAGSQEGDRIYGHGGADTIDG